MALSNRPNFTESFSVENYQPPPGSSVVFGRSVEERSAFAAGIEPTSGLYASIEISEQDAGAFTWTGGELGEGTVRLRSDADLEHFIGLLPADNLVTVDITGLSHHVWAPILRTGLRLDRDLRLLYVEPVSYKRHTAPTEFELFDLSERIEGVAPLPGFARLDSYDDVLFAPLLGFEGRRLAYVLETVQPSDDRIYPIIGVPGFRPEFPTYAYEGNRVALAGSSAWTQVHYARANCPFSLYYALADIERYASDLRMALALVGTKPHAVGAVLFALLSEHGAELIYDYPVRKEQRTSGSSHVLVYRVSEFARWLSA